MTSPELLTWELQRPELPMPHARGLLGVAALFKQTWTLYRSRFWTLIGIVFIALAIVLLLTTGLLALGTAADNALARRIALPDDVVFFGFALLAWILAWLVQLWSELALIYAVKDAEERIGIREAFERGWIKILPYLWVTILGGLVALGSFLFFFVPGLLVSVWLFPALYVLVSENERGFNTLTKSKKYVEGHWWPVLLRLLALTALWLILMAPVMLLGALTDIPEDLLDIVSGIPAILLTPFATAYLYLLYRNLKDAKGGDVVPTDRDRKILMWIPLAGFLLAATAIILAVIVL